MAKVPWKDACDETPNPYDCCYSYPTQSLPQIVSLMNADDVAAPSMHAIIDELFCDLTRDWNSVAESCKISSIV